MKNKKTLFTSLLAMVCTFSFIHSDENVNKIAVVNFSECVHGSKYGIREQASLEKVQNELKKGIQDLHNQLNQIVTKLQDEDYRDAISQEEEKALQSKLQLLNEELNRYQGQYYQTMQQANMKMLQAMHEKTSEAAKAVAKEEGIGFMLNSEAALSFPTSHDATKSVLSKLDQWYDKEASQVEKKALALTDKAPKK